MTKMELICDRVAIPLSCSHCFPVRILRTLTLVSNDDLRDVKDVRGETPKGVFGSMYESKAELGGVKCNGPPPLLAAEEKDEESEMYPPSRESDVFSPLLEACLTDADS